MRYSELGSGMENNVGPSKVNSKNILIVLFLILFHRSDRRNDMGTCYCCRDLIRAATRLSEPGSTYMAVHPRLSFAYFHWPDPLIFWGYYNVTGKNACDPGWDWLFGWCVYHQTNPFKRGPVKRIPGRHDLAVDLYRVRFCFPHSGRPIYFVRLCTKDCPGIYGLYFDQHIQGIFHRPASVYGFRSHRLPCLLWLPILSTHTVCDLRGQLPERPDTVQNVFSRAWHEPGPGMQCLYGSHSCFSECPLEKRQVFMGNVDWMV